MEIFGNKFLESESFEKLSRKDKGLSLIFYAYFGGIDNFIRYQNLKKNIESLRNGIVIVPPDTKNDPLNFLEEELENFKNSFDNPLKVFAIHSAIPTPCISSKILLFTPIPALVKLFKTDPLIMFLLAQGERAILEKKMAEIKKLIKKNKSEKIKIETKNWNLNEFEGDIHNTEKERIIALSLIMAKKVKDKTVETIKKFDDKTGISDKPTFIKSKKAVDDLYDDLIREKGYKNISPKDLKNKFFEAFKTAKEKVRKQKKKIKTRTETVFGKAMDKGEVVKNQTSGTLKKVKGKVTQKRNMRKSKKRKSSTKIPEIKNSEFGKLLSR